MPTNKPKRLLATLTGHYHELLAVHARTSAHKLPGGKGALREEAVAKFIRAWVQPRYKVKTNAFAVSRKGDEFPSELDLIIHDGHSGALWDIDAEGRNCVATWEEVRLIAQIKSTLDQDEFDGACKVMSRMHHFAKNAGTDRPTAILFAYKVDKTFVPTLLEKFTYLSANAFPFDAFITLDEGAYFSDSLRELRVGIENGLSPSVVKNDGPSQDRLLQEDCIQSSIPNGFRLVSDRSPESSLLSLATLATFASSGDDVVTALLAACLTAQQFPISD